MKFGKEFRTHLEETLPEWRDKYLSYKPLKKLLKNIPAPAGVDGPPLPELQEWFVRILNEELEKFNDFYVDKEEDFIIRFQALKELIERVKARGSNNGVLSSETEFSEEMMEIRKDFVAIHGEMVLLKNYSSLNLAGLIKILKKYDKRTGELLSVPFTQLVVHQPFFTTEPLTRLVRECEANLEDLFPLEAEVVESTPVKPNQTDTTISDILNTSPETTLPLGEETLDIYRRTLAAIRAIQGFKKASSTDNPLSLSYLFGKQDNESTGAVTAGNSPSDSLVSLDKGEGPNEDVHSPK
ncbi:Protein involved in vacuolar polyphosphate accumulation, contains SPX domain [Handroanthus impetiginosus]|uniref:Protein involved in vacuolar polyphosphate accumulation, contains SPX domain n=1 Tax=Handroanthus impetiginosus TaxID=429701 RepID=A0A2G9GGK7_9LAMI|nr:Protein involved in vacuolar polyphosphate accumulation, contains SPX domain [Handroanthus impetiginosus]